MTGFEAVLVTLGGHVQPDATGGVGDPFAHEPEETTMFSNPLNLTGDALITAERWRVMLAGYTIEHDIEHGTQELVQAAASYLDGDTDWPWSDGYKTGPTRIDELIRAGQLIAAAIDVELALQEREELPDPT